MSRRDTELMLRVQEGDYAAFDDLVERHQKPIINFFYRLLLDREAAEDCAQEVFLRIFRSRLRYSRKAKFTTFMYRIARNLWIDRLRHEAIVPHTASIDAPRGKNGTDNCTLGDVLPGVSPEPPSVVSEGELVSLVTNALERLPEEQRMVVILGELQGLRYSEISEIMEIPLGTVKSRMHSAVMKLREILAGE